MVFAIHFVVIDKAQAGLFVGLRCGTAESCYTLSEKFFTGHSIYNAGWNFLADAGERYVRVSYAVKQKY